MLCIKFLQCLNVIRTSFIPRKIICNYIFDNYCSFLWTLKIEKKILTDSHVNTVVRIFCSCRFCHDGLMLLQGVSSLLTLPGAMSSTFHFKFWLQWKQFPNAFLENKSFVIESSLNSTRGNSDNEISRSQSMRIIQVTTAPVVLFRLSMVNVWYLLCGPVTM